MNVWYTIIKQISMKLPLNLRSRRIPNDPNISVSYFWGHDQIALISLEVTHGHVTWSAQ